MFKLLFRLISHQQCGREYYMEVLKKEMLNYYTFHAMHSTESQIVDRQIISTDKPKPLLNIHVLVAKITKQTFQVQI